MKPRPIYRLTGELRLVHSAPRERMSSAPMPPPGSDAQWNCRCVAVPIDTTTKHRRPRLMIAAVAATAIVAAALLAITMGASL